MTHISKIFYTLTAGFLLGVATYSLHNLGFYAGIFFILLGTSLLFLSGIRKRFNESYALLLFASLFFISFGLGGIRLDISRENPNSLLSSKIDQEIEIVGVVIEEPDKREKQTLLTLEIESILNGEENEEVSSKILVFSERFPEYKYGDRLEIRAELVEPEGFETDTGRIFDYKNFLAKENIHFVMYRPEIELVDSGNGNRVKETLLSMKQSLIGGFSGVIPEPESSLLAGLLLGAKQALPSDLQDVLRTAGIIHIVVLSGYNITIVANSFMRIFAIFGFWPRLITGGAGIILFAIMTGASATVVRASAMALLVLVAQGLRRSYDITRALLIAGLLMVVHNPMILLFDPSFQLSFLATVGLIYVSPFIEKYVEFIPKFFELRGTAIATIATQITVLPLIIYMSGQFSLVALPVNLLVLLFIPLTMLFGFLTGILGFISVYLAMPFGWLSYALLHYELWIATVFASFPFSSVIIPPIPGWLIILAYTILFFILFFFLQNKSTGRMPDDSETASQKFI